MSRDLGYDCALPFDRDDPQFVYGVEVGRLWEQLKSGDEVVQTVHAVNSEMMMRLAEAAGRQFRAEELDENWIEITFAANPEVEMEE